MTSDNVIWVDNVDPHDYHAVSLQNWNFFPIQKDRMAWKKIPNSRCSRSFLRHLIKPSHSSLNFASDRLPCFGESGTWKALHHRKYVDTGFWSIHKILERTIILERRDDISVRTSGIDTKLRRVMVIHMIDNTLKDGRSGRPRPRSGLLLRSSARPDQVRDGSSSARSLRRRQRSEFFAGLPKKTSLYGRAPGGAKARVEARVTGKGRL